MRVSSLLPQCWAQGLNSGLELSGKLLYLVCHLIGPVVNYSTVCLLSLLASLSTLQAGFFIVFCCYFMDTESPHTTQENSKKFLEV